MRTARTCDIAEALTQVRLGSSDTVLALPRPLPSAIGMGAHNKASLCLIDGDSARITPDAGDLATLEAAERYEALLAGLLATGARPLVAANDLHPDFLSTRAAATARCPTLSVQHHHAHILATQWEHGLEGPVLGLALDGFGLGPGGESWGGELLHVDGLEYRRLGHLAPLPQPGGDRATREPWRMGAAALWQLGRGSEIGGRYSDQPHADRLADLIDRGLRSPLTCSCGRLFDAACGLLDVRPIADFEGQAPMELEKMVTLPEEMQGGWTLDDGVLDFGPLLERLSEMTAGPGANLFHGTLVAGLAEQVLAARGDTGLAIVAFGGGCFLNRVLTGELTVRLESAGMTVLRPERLSPGDAGISFGQAIAGALHAERIMGNSPCV